MNAKSTKINSLFFVKFWNLDILMTYETYQKLMGFQIRKYLMWLYRSSKFARLFRLFHIIVSERALHVSKINNDTCAEGI